MKATLRMLYDEGALPMTGYIGAEGFSMVVDVDGESTMFGVGRRPRYMANNLNQAEFETDALTRIVIPDPAVQRAGGLQAVLAERERPIEVLASPETWAAQPRGLPRRGGIVVPAESEEKVVRTEVSEWTKLSEHLWASAPIGGETFLVIRGALGPVVLSACCACGVTEMFSSARTRFERDPVGFVGAFRVGKGKRGDATADAAAAEFQSSRTSMIYLNHCTTDRGINRVRADLGLDAVRDFYVGQTVEVNDLLRGLNYRKPHARGMAKTLVAYFSATGTTKAVAERLASAIGADIAEIVPAPRYTDADLDWKNASSRNCVEQKDPASRPKMAAPVDVSGYDEVLVGFPVWWYEAPHIVYTFLESADLSGKKVAAFATSGGSPIGKGEGLMKECAPKATWGKCVRVDASASSAELKKWADSAF